MRLIDADKIIEVAEYVWNEWNLAMATQDTNRGVNRVLKMQELCKCVKAVADDCPTIDPESLRPRWIPVEERLPDTDKDVLVYATTKFIGGSKIVIDKLEEGEQRPIWLYTHGWFEVTHWMPLPDLPKETIK